MTDNVIYGTDFVAARRANESAQLHALQPTLRYGLASSQALAPDVVFVDDTIRLAHLLAGDRIFKADFPFCELPGYSDKDKDKDSA